MFPNRIENDRNGNKATALVSQHLLLCSWLCGCVSVRCQSHQSQNGFTETLKCSGGVTRQKPPNPPERSACAVVEEKQGCRWGNTTVHQKVSRNHLAPKDLRWHDGRSYDVLNCLKKWGHASGHPEQPTGI